MKFRLASCCLALLAVLSATGIVQAGFTPYFTQADFQNAINSGGLITTANIDFNSLATGSLGGPSYSTHRTISQKLQWIVVSMLGKGPSRHDENIVTLS